MPLRMLFQLFLGFIGLVAFTLIGSYALVSLKSDGYVYANSNDVATYQYGVVLGTSPFLRDGNRNPYFNNRIKAAAELYHLDKIEKVLLSGDFSPPYYNEPGRMRQAMIEHDIPEEDLTLDPNGFRTFDSVLRANKEFGLDSFLIISQQFHAERAVFIAKRYRINAVAFAANDPDMYFKWLSTTFLREYLARVRSIWDCYIIEPSLRG